MTEDLRPAPPTVVLPLRAWLALSHLTVLLLPVVVVVGSGTLAKDLRDQTRWDLEHQAALIAMNTEAEVRRAREDRADCGIACRSAPLSDLLRRAKHETLSGFQITNTRGEVVASSARALGEDLSGAPEVAMALTGRGTSMVRPRPRQETYHPLSSQSRRARVRLFVAQPVILDGEILGVIVVSRTPREEMQALYQMAPRAALAAFGAALITLGLAWGAGILASRSLRALDRGAMRVADGDFGGIADLSSPEQSHIKEVAGSARSLTRMARRLKARLSYIGEFASNVSHEFKTPLATLRGTVELLADDEGMAVAQRERFLGNAAREVDRMERLVSGLLSLARADEAEASGSIELQELVEAVGTTLQVSITGRAARIRGDRSQIEAVATNLVCNARIHGGDGVIVRVVAWTREGWTGFDVEDDGGGISAANLPHVFDRFFTTDRGQGGTGLGLALVRAIVVRHGGEVTVDSAPGRTVFSVILPMGPDPDEAR